MLRQFCHEIQVATSGRGLYEITNAVATAVNQAAMKTGVATVLVRHTSASLVIQENADPDVREDLERFFHRLVPDGDALFRHDMEGDDDMPAHVRSALTSVTLSIPVIKGRLALGTWQGIFLWEHRVRPHHRHVVIHIVGE